MVLCGEEAHVKHVSIGFDGSGSSLEKEDGGDDAFHKENSSFPEIAHDVSIGFDGSGSSRAFHEKNSSFPEIAHNLENGSTSPRKNDAERKGCIFHCWMICSRSSVMVKENTDRKLCAIRLVLVTGIGDCCDGACQENRCAE